MSSYATSLDGESLPSDAEMQEMMVDKAHELFAVCDTEDKGFITKRDMQRLQAQLPLSPDQLEAVFDSLDDDGNGYLTLDEFTDGFGSFLGLKGSCDLQTSVDTTDTDTYMEDSATPAADHLNFTDMMENMGANSLFDDESTIEAMWCRLRKENPEMSTHFEDFLYKVSFEMRKSKVDFDTLEGALKSKTSAHDEEVKKLYEEMEFQIKHEKDRVLAEEKARERQLREAMELELLEKDHQLQEFNAKHQQMEEVLAHLNTVEVETKVENDRLAKEKETLEESLLKSQDSLEESRAYISQLREQQKQEKKERAKATLTLSEGITLERETLVNQLDLLRSVNKQLRDDKDEADTRRVCDASPGAATPSKQPLERQGSSLGKYFPTSRIPKLSSCAQSISEDVVEEGGDTVDDGIECDDDVYIDHDPLFIHHNISTYQTGSRAGSFTSPRTRANNYTPPSSRADNYTSPSSRSDNYTPPNSRADNYTPHNSRADNYTPPSSRADNYTPHSSRADNYTPPSSRHGHVSLGQPGRLTQDNGCDFPDNVSSCSSYIPDSPRVQPIGADQTSTPTLTTPAEHPTLQRMFKVVFVGDSSVGKSSFIHRFCHNHFRPTFAATVGVDFQIKSIIMEGVTIVLQLWDTAGQERFRSITKQYFRKADGVIVMYDVNTETSFTNVRNWMISVQEGANEDAITVLLGNKTDLRDDHMTGVKHKDGSNLADEYGSLFYETSANTGDNVFEAMEALARVLKEKEDKEIEKSFRLVDTVDKNGCCGS